MASAPRVRGPACCALALLISSASAADPTASDLPPPLAVRDQNPLLRPFYLPAARLAPEEGLGFSGALAWSNTTNLPHTASEQIYVDEETAEINLRATWRRGNWLAAAEVPLLWRGGGVLDGLIDDFHSLLGVNRGDRPYVHSNSYRVAYDAKGAPPYSATRGTSLGDVPVEVGRLLYSAPGTEWSVWAGAKLPTGSLGHASGSGSVDTSAWMSAGHALSSHIDLYAQAGAMRPGGPGEFVRVSRYVEFGTLGLDWRATGRITVLAQADAHSALPASTLNFLKPAVVGTVGARFAVGRSLAVDAGIQEDLATNHSPDVTFYFALRHGATRRCVDR